MRDTLNHLARKIDKTVQAFGPNMGFTLMVYPMNSDASIGQYVSNGRREDVVKALREFADHLENTVDTTDKF